MKSKTKIMTIAAASLACVAVAGVGFASWVITNEASTNVSGNIAVDSVSDERVELTAVATEGQINLTHSGYTGTNNWLKYEGEEAGKEDLTATITLTVSGIENASSVTVSFTTLNEDGAAYTILNGTSLTNTAAGQCNFAGAVANELITYPTLTIDEAVFTTTDGNYSIPVANLNNGANTITVTFGWGSKFKPTGDGAVPVNPAKYYNDQAYDSALANAAEDYLSYLEEALDAKDGNDPETSNPYLFTYKFTFAAASA